MTIVVVENDPAIDSL